MATENRSNNCKNQTSNRTSNQTSNRTSNQTTNQATNEHKHPNQYTKGADDEPAALRHCFPVRKAAGFRVFISRWGRTAATAYQTARAHGSADRSGTASPAGIRSRWKHGIPPGKRALPHWLCWRCGPV